MKPSQSVTERYLTNLLRNGRNKEFDIISIAAKDVIVDEVILGVYYDVTVCPTSDVKGLGWKAGAGATPSHALRRCLTKHGVTFR